MKLAGMVTVYHPDNDVIDHIKTYLPELDVLYVLDNTEIPDKNFEIKIKALDNVQYIAFNQNTGISFALNYALKEASLQKYLFLLTMDQDSYFYEGMMRQYKKDIEEYEKSYPNYIGVYAVHYTGCPEIHCLDEEIHQLKYAITSGSIISIPIAMNIGGFDNELFIDEVDNDFCIRIRKNGNKIIEFPHVLMKHSLGNVTTYSIASRNFTTTNHNEIRRYYIARNKVHLLLKYPEIRKKYIIDIVKLIMKILLAESNKINKLRYILRGVLDGCLNKMGKYNN